MTINSFSRILCEIFDFVPSDSFASTFVSDGDVDTDKVMAHRALHVNMVFCAIWNHLFKVVPTKQDYKHFLSTIGLNLELCTAVNFDKGFLDKLLSCIPLINCGIMPVQIEELSKVYEASVQRIDTTMLYSKLSHRFQIPRDELISKNILEAVLHAYASSNAPIVNTNRKMNPISRSINESINVDDIDAVMTPSERVQYLICQDAHFLLGLSESIVINVDPQQEIDDDVIQLIAKQAQTSFDSRVILFNYWPEWHDATSCFDVPSELIPLIPSLSRIHINVSHDRTPSTKPICRNRDQAIHYSHTPFRNNVINVSYCEMYDKRISNVFDNVPSIVTYTIFDPTDINANALSNKSHKITCRIVMLLPILKDHTMKASFMSPAKLTLSLIRPPIRTP
jgi:hypothetical protein